MLTAVQKKIPDDSIYYFFNFVASNSALCAMRVCIILPHATRYGRRGVFVSIRPVSVWLTD